MRWMKMKKIVSLLLALMLAVSRCMQREVCQ